ncbi:MAG TPA: hypothetical protein PLG62_07250 [Pararhodobacter sp.]|nr:hypothetical protein [Pararhodobacter sp.]HPD92244.1 hypothetical protein [Pararhodobacter sp.]
MKRFLRQIHQPRDERLAMLGDAAGAIGLFILLLALLHLPLMS